MNSYENIIPYSQEHLEWPYITLYRFDIILKAKNELVDYDWIVFLDADMVVNDNISKEEFLDESKSFIGVHHPCHYLKMPPHDKYPGSFEVNTLSTAKIPNDYDFSVYWQGEGAKVRIIS